mgnify:CR=1 FL=1
MESSVKKIEILGNIRTFDLKRNFDLKLNCWSNIEISVKLEILSKNRKKKKPSIYIFGEWRHRVIRRDHAGVPNIPNLKRHMTAATWSVHSQLFGLHW